MSDSTESALGVAIAGAMEKTSQNIDNSAKEPEIPQEELKQAAPDVEKTNQEQEEELLKPVEAKALTPEAMEEIRRNWNRSYTQKRQKEREEMRQMQQELEELRQLRQSPPVTARKALSPDLVEAQNAVQQQMDLGQITPEQFFEYTQSIAAENAARIAEGVIAQREDAIYQNQALSEFNSLDSRFDDRYTNPDSPEFNRTNAWMYQQVATRMADALSEYQAQNGTSVGFDTKGLASQFIAEFDEYADQLVRSRVQGASAQAQAKSQSIARTIPRGTTSPSISTGKRDLRSLISENLNS